MIRRIALLAAATAREGLLPRSLLLASLLAVAWWSGARGLDVDAPAGSAALLFERQLTLLGWLGGAAALLAGAHAIGRDRRAQQIDGWRRSPLRARELLAGRALGVTLQVAAALLPLWSWLLVGDAHGLLRQRELLAPRATLAPLAVERRFADGSRLAWRRGAAVVDPGERLELRFPTVPTGEHELVVPWRAGASPGNPPPHFTVRIDGEPVLTTTGGELARAAIAVAAGRAPLLAIEVAPDSGVVRFELPEVVVRAAPGSLLSVAARLAAGGALLLLLAALLGVTLAALLPEGLALLGGAVLLLLCELKALLLDVAGAVHAGHGHAPAEVALVAVANAYEKLVAWLPDATLLRGAERAARALPPWSRDDLVPFAVAAGFVAGLALLGGAVLRRVPRGAR